MASRGAFCSDICSFSPAYRFLPARPLALALPVSPVLRNSPHKSLYLDMDIVADLALQIAWGADEFLADTPQDRRIAAASSPAPVSDAKPPAARATPSFPLVGPVDAARIAQACTTLPALAAALAAFTGCPLRETATNLVFADGPDHADLMLIGEAPGPEEDRDGRPFIGPAGQLLNQMLASIGQNRDQLRLTTILPWRPPGNRAPNASEITACLPFIHRHIALVAPKALVLLGAVAACVAHGTALKSLAWRHPSRLWPPTTRIIYPARPWRSPNPGTTCCACERPWSRVF
ncbi:MAG: uracil-DNA glycosylase [Acidocella sp.]|nr:uracil-DNA glycosylase [Acidocella sp.]